MQSKFRGNKNRKKFTNKKKAIKTIQNFHRHNIFKNTLGPNNWNIFENQEDNNEFENTSDSNNWQILENQEDNENLYSGGSQFIHISGVGKRKIRYYKNGKPYVIIKGKKVKIWIIIP